MSDRQYPLQIDCVWIASDRNGRLGAFITAGESPIPAEVFNQAFVDVPDIEAQIYAMPVVGEAWLVITPPRPDSYIALAERGFHVFDWTDIHRSTATSLDAYELVATPERSAGIEALPHELGPIAAGIRFAEIDFGSEPNLDVRAHKSCVEAGWPEDN